MEQYWLIYRRFDANERQTKPFASKDAATKWAIENNYEILGIAEQFNNQCIATRLVVFINKAESIKNMPYNSAECKYELNNLIKQIQTLQKHLEEE